MNNIGQNVFLALICIIGYGSGLLLLPLRRLLNFKKKVRGKYLARVFIAQLAAYAVVACLSVFVQIGHFYDWFMLLIMLNVVFTLAGIVAWIFDVHHFAD